MGIWTEWILSFLAQYILQTRHIPMFGLELTKQVFYFTEDLYLCTQYSTK